MTGTAHDRTLAAAEDQFRTIFEQAAVGIAVLTPQGRFLRVNRRLCSMLDYAEAALLELNLLDLAVPEDRDAAEAAIDSVVRGTQDDGATETRYRRRDGETLCASVIIQAVQPAPGVATSIIAVLKDVTERQRYEQRLRDSEMRFRQVVEAAPSAMVMCDATGRITLVNREAETMFGYPRAELLGQSIEMLLPERYRPKHQHYHQSFAAVPRARLMGAGRHLTALRKDGSEIAVEIGLTQIDTDQRLSLATVVDITERRRQEAALKATEEQLRQAQKMEAIGNLTGGMAHDFNNLLSVIIGSLDLAAPLLQGDVGELVHDALEAALRGAELTQRLLAFARRQPLSPRPVDINHMVTGIARLLRRTLGENIQVSLELAGGLWLVVVDPAQLEASLVSLATNARDAMPGGGRLTITTANRTLDADYALLHMDVTPGDYVMVEVDDTGTGMTRDVLDHAFEPFFTTKQPGKGTGLGLSMVFGVIKQSGGNINVYSEPGTGTTFRLYLPRTRGAADAAVAETPAPQPAHHETVLVVEDNAALRRVVTRQLTRLGYAVLEAPDAEAALVLLAERPVDLLFTDIVMPGEMDGIALARQALARWPQVKAVLTSGFPGSTFGSHLGTLAATTQILTKPYRIEDLAAALRTALKG